MEDLNIFQNFQQALQQANTEKQKLEKTRKQAFQTIADTTKSAKAELDGQCLSLLQKQKQIDDQVMMQKQIQSWTELIKKFNDVLKDLGDATQTSNVILNDLQEIQQRMK